MTRYKLHRNCDKDAMVVSAARWRQGRRMHGPRRNGASAGAGGSPRVLSSLISCNVDERLGSPVQCSEGAHSRGTFRPDGTNRRARLRRRGCGFEG